MVSPAQQRMDRMKGAEAMCESGRGLRMPAQSVILANGVTANERAKSNGSTDTDTTKGAG